MIEYLMFDPFSGTYVWVPETLIFDGLASRRGYRLSIRVRKL